MQTLLSLDNVHKSYSIRNNELCVLRGASLDIMPGERVAVVGHSGAGKSTLLHILGSLDAPDSGSVFYKGEDIYRLSARERSDIRAAQIGFVFQSYHLLPELDVLENVVLPAMTGKGPTRALIDMQKRGRELLAYVGLAERAEHRPMELSGGEQQRLALARAMMNDPEVILADEPTGNLDDDTAAHVLDHVFGLVEKRGRTLVLVTHNESLASRCDRVLHLADGIID